MILSRKYTSGRLIGVTSSLHSCFFVLMTIVLGANPQHLLLLLDSSGKSKASSGLIGLPSHVSQGFSCQLRGQTCYAEVTVGCPITETDKALSQGSNTLRSECLPAGRCDQKVSQDHSSTYEKTFIYPNEAVLVPVLNASLTRSSLRRCTLVCLKVPSLLGFFPFYVSNFK